MRTTSSRPQSLLLYGTALLLFLLAFSPALQILLEKWRASEEYSHAFLVMPIALYIGWSKRHEVNWDSVRFSFTGLLGVVIFSFFYYFALLTEVHTIILLSLYCCLTSAFVFLLGLQFIRIFATPLILFLILIPIPEQLYIQLTFPLQLKVSKASELIPRTFGIPIFREGNIMNIPGKSFEVVDACSGLRSVIALSALSILVGYFMLTRPLSKVILFIMSIPIAVLVNIMRVVCMILAYCYFKLDLTEDTLHSFVGIGVFIVSLVLLLLTEKILEFWERH